MQNINYDRKMEEIIRENREKLLKPKLLLQVCCAPCSSQVLTRLRDDFNLDIFYYNPNIYPEKEYEKRAKAVKDLVKQMKIDAKVIISENRPKDFYKYVDTRKDDVEGGKSCYKCYYLRLKETARLAKEKAYDYFTTSLSISPYKNAQWLNEIGAKLEKEYGIKYLYADFKKKNGYKASIELSKKYGLYRQDYCGCIFSYREMKEKKGKSLKKIE
ncbi:MAG: epoxyqueuosine reductase QueH [Peptoniphilaceae bacterium]|nr:epoxyqueuosine reductase QueH [Peptoniphilaceae bacterium]MDY6019453.1 epoxyqueuosine reductase QueH [Anaerococcus sp.]